MDKDIGFIDGAREQPFENTLIPICLFVLLIFSNVVARLCDGLLGAFNYAFPNPLSYTLNLFNFLALIFVTITLMSGGTFGGVAYLLGFTVNPKYNWYAAMTIATIISLYCSIKMSRSFKEKQLSVKLQALHLPFKRINQLLFSSVNKGYFEHLKPNVWFDMVAYISDSNDGVRSYYKKHDWLKCFILPLDKESSGNMSEDYQGAYAKFELAPAEFIKQIERFSELLLTRDLCKLLLEYLGKSTHENRDDLLLDFWVRLQAAIHNIIQSARSSSTATTTQANHLESLDRMRLSLQQFRESKSEYSHSSTVNQLQECLNRFINDKELQITDTSK
ncbi:hypothetical protein MMC17_005227 [Xylographa soralifera]|nr:hypothetical protein [Xylographa soralifera]